MGESDSGRVAKKKGVLACLSCRKRKVKCNINERFPCNACSMLGMQCVKSTTDKRKERSESEYMHKLESKLKMYEEEHMRISNQLVDIASVMKELSNLSHSFSGRSISSLNATQDNEVEERLNNYAEVVPNENQDPNTSSISASVVSAEPRPSILGNEVSLVEKYPTPVSFKAFDNKFLSVYGPTSIFDTISLSRITNNQEAEDYYKLNRDPKVVHYIKLFFTWQYPDIHIFIFREAFLLDFFHAKTNSSYCSKELIFAICSFGCLLTDNPSRKSISFKFFQKARELCFHNYYKPSISLLQSFLLLGLYEIYNGRNESGWFMSGIAMRMGYSIGLQLSPTDLMSDNAKGALGNKIRSRIFWGTYLVDHLIGLLLGRPSSLKMNDSTIEETIELPDIDWMHEYSFQDKDRKRVKVLKIGDPLRATVSLMDLTESMLKEVFNDKQTNRKKKSVELHEKLIVVKKYNSKILKWRKDLPTELLWNRADLEKLGSDPTKLTFKLLYYIVLLCLNRPFLNLKSTENFPNYQYNFSRICSNAISDLAIVIRKFVQTYGFGKCSTLITYCCVISISVILRSAEGATAKSLTENGIYKYELLLFTMTLQKCSVIWGLSEKAFELTKQRLTEDYKIDIDGELENFDPFQNIDMLANQKGEDADSFETQKHDDIDIFEAADENGVVFTDNDYVASREDSFGGPPIFMTSNTFPSLDALFSDNSANLFDYEI